MMGSEGTVTELISSLVLPTIPLFDVAINSTSCAPDRQATNGRIVQSPANIENVDPTIIPSQMAKISTDRSSPSIMPETFPKGPKRIGIIDL